MPEVTSTLLIFVLVIACLLLSAEILARVWIRHDRRYFVRRPYYRYNFDMLPAASYLLNSPIRTVINSDGERGNEVPCSDGKLYRVLVAGGSFVECGVLTQDQTWPALLEKTLHQHRASFGADQVHVGNIGVSELDTHALSAILEKILPRYPQLDLLLLGTGFACAMRWLLDGAQPERGPSTMPKAERFAQYPEMPLKWYPPSSTALYEIARRVAYRYWDRTIELPQAGRRMIACRKRRAESKGQHLSLMTDPSAMLLSMEQGLRRAIDLARTRTSRIILVRQPWFDKEHLTDEEEQSLWIGQVEKGLSESSWKFLSRPDLLRLLASVDQTVLRVAHDCQLETIELQSVVRTRSGMFYDDFHLSEAGAAEVAIGVASEILSYEIANWSSTQSAEADRKETSARSLKPSPAAVR